ncbi:hypothetical protein [Streptomyces sp. NPDC002889]|uniref:hypothetical protein n=1 Tax=Streptomyces sp. NPDC002889 TaxID=3364669 RepID=UPI0036D04531
MSVRIPLLPLRRGAGFGLLPQPFAQLLGPFSEKPAADPSLRELVERILSNHVGEPRMVSEVRTELEEKYPGRTTSAQVVRNTLENLANKGIIEKGRQQGPVMYTKPTSAAAETDAAPAPADNKAAKVPAEA